MNKWGYRGFTPIIFGVLEAVPLKGTVSLKRGFTPINSGGVEELLHRAMP